MDWVIYVALICGALGVAYSLITAGWVFKQDAGSKEMQDISSYVAEGAMAYLTRQYRVVAIIAHTSPVGAIHRHVPPRLLRGNARPSPSHLYVMTQPCRPFASPFLPLCPIIVRSPRLENRYPQD